MATRVPNVCTLAANIAAQTWTRSCPSSIDSISRLHLSLHVCALSATVLALLTLDIIPAPQPNGIPWQRGFEIEGKGAKLNNSAPVSPDTDRFAAWQVQQQQPILPDPSIADHVAATREGDNGRLGESGQDDMLQRVDDRVSRLLNALESLPKHRSVWPTRSHLSW